MASENESTIADAAGPIGPKSPAKNPVEVPVLSEPCFVYIIASGDLVKIGISKDPDSRLRGISTGSPYRPRIVSKVALDSRRAAQAIEVRLHRIFGKYRENGEWFRVSVNHAARTLHRVVADSRRDPQQVIAEAFRRGRDEPDMPGTGLPF